MCPQGGGELNQNFLESAQGLNIFNMISKYYSFVGISVSVLNLCYHTCCLKPTPTLTPKT